MNLANVIKTNLESKRIKLDLSRNRKEAEAAVLLQQILNQVYLEIVYDQETEVVVPLDQVSDDLYRTYLTKELPNSLKEHGLSVTYKKITYGPTMGVGSPIGCYTEGEVPPAARLTIGLPE